MPVRISVRVPSLTVTLAHLATLSSSWRGEISWFSSTGTDSDSSTMGAPPLSIQPSTTRMGLLGVSTL